MKKIFILLITIFSIENGFTQNTKWVSQAGVPSRATIGNAITTDVEGNTYVTGNFSGSTNFGGVTLAAFAIDVFIAKYDKTGTLIWVKQAGGAGAFNLGYGIAVDASGYVFVTGYIAGTTDFGGTTLTPVGNNDVFIAKYNNSGNLQWAKHAGAASKYTVGYGITVDASGNIDITGKFQGTVDFGGITITSIGSNRDNIFVASYNNSAGTLLWVKQGGSVNRSGNVGYGIAADTFGNVIVTGTLEGSTTFAGTSVASTGNPDMFLASFNTSGTLNWVIHVGKPSVQNPGYLTSYPVMSNAVTTDGSGNIYVTGTFTGSTNFGGTTLTPGIANDIYIAKYNSIGNLYWVKQAGINGNQNYSYAISSDASSNCYVTGAFSGSATFGGTMLTSIGTQDVYITKYNNIGTFEWVKQAGAANKFTSGQGITVDVSYNIYTIGYFSGITSFISTTLSPIGTQDFFVWALEQNTPCSPILFPTGTITTNQKAAKTVITTGTNTIQNAANVIYQAGDFVQLNPGFMANNSSVFTAKILTGCN